MRIALVLIAALAMSASAQDGERPGMFRFSPVLSALDTNHDSILSADEIDNAPASLRKLDRNGDGKLTSDEYSPAFAGRGPGRGQGRGEGRGEGGPPVDTSAELVQTLMAFDKNHDGKLSKDELPERMQGMFDRGDTNKDGFLSPDEIRVMAAAQAPPDNGRDEERGEGRGEGRGRGGFMRQDPVITALDTNHDGVISADEIADASASLRTLDTNHDGRITEDEVRPAGGGRGGRGPRGGGNPNGPPQNQ